MAKSIKSSFVIWEMMVSAWQLQYFVLSEKFVLLPFI